MAQSKRRLFSVVQETELPAGAEGVRQPGDQVEGADEFESGERRSRRATVGDLLRDARERAGMTVEDVAFHLRIRRVHIEAIENGEFQHLPGPVYAAGFIRQYAEFLDLDPQYLVELFRNESEGVQRKHELNFPAPAPEGRVPGGALMVLAILLAAAAYGGWYYLSATDRSVADILPPLPERFAAMLGIEQTAVLAPEAPATETAASVVTETQPTQAGAPVPPVATTVVDPVDTSNLPQTLPPAPAVPGIIAVTPPAGGLTLPQLPSVPVTDPGVTAGMPGADVLAPLPTIPGLEPTASSRAGDVSSTPQPSSEASADGPVASALAAQPAAAATDAAPVAAPPSGGARVVIRATSESWLKITDASGAPVMTRVLKPGESYEVPEQSGLRMVVGNAGGIEIAVDGQTLPPLGREGQVLRDVSLEPDRLKARQTN